MKTAFKTTLVVGLLTISLLGASMCWFYFFQDFAAVANFAPASTTTVPDQCSMRGILAIPFTALGKDLQSATRAAEGDGKEVLAVQIARGLFCDSRMKQLKRQLLEYKASVQLRRRFTYEQLLTIYLNRAYFGDHLVGVESASLHYCGKHASELDIPQAALIAGLMKGPVTYSPELHPDRAKMRRDAVIAVMLKMGTITTEQAGAAVRTAIR